MPFYGFLKRLSLENDKKQAENGLLVRKHPSLELPQETGVSAMISSAFLRKVVSLEQQRLLGNRQDSFPWKNLPPTKSLRNKLDTRRLLKAT